MMNKEQFTQELNKLDIFPTENQMKQLDQYYQLLIKWNEQMNLTGITDEEQVYLKHFYDSLTICKSLNLNEQETLCDVGTGAGFPGIVLKIFFPNLSVTLLDSLNKRLLFLNEVIKELGLNDIETKHSRAEEYALIEREKYDVVTARAVAPLNILLEYCIPLIKRNKFFVAMKGDIAQEIIGLPSALKKINAKLLKQEQFLLPFEQSKRAIIVVTKSENTINKYPRKFSEIKKNPL